MSKEEDVAVTDKSFLAIPALGLSRKQSHGLAALCGLLMTASEALTNSNSPPCCLQNGALRSGMISEPFSYGLRGQKRHPTELYTF